MALKPHRHIVAYRTPHYFMNEVAERGGITVASTVGSGQALDQAAMLVTYVAQASGKVPIGVLEEDMVNVDLTLYKLNQHRDQVQLGGKVSLIRIGEVLTNYIEGTGPTAAGPAYVGHSGRFRTTIDGNLPNSPQAGNFLAKADEDGYALVAFNLV
jgi:hypothetical protein